MMRFVAGVIVGGALVWFWGDRMREVAQGQAKQARDTVARGLENVQATADSALNRAKDRVDSALQAGQQYVRGDD